MALTAVHECVGAAGQAFSDGFANAGNFLWESTGAGDVVDCLHGDAASCGMVALNVVPGGRAAKAVKQTLVRARRSAKVTQRVKNTLNRVQTAARSATSRIKRGPDVRAKTPAHVPNAFRWVAADQTYFPFNRDDFGFALIEIVDSEQISRMLDEGMYADQPAGQRLGGTIDEADLRHYRIGFDEYGSFDVICLGLRVERFTASS